MCSSVDVCTSALYIVPTPIGNLQDITYRALFTLRNVDYVAAEDTRRTRILLNFFSIRTSLYSFHQYNELKKTPILIEKLKSGLSVALVSDAGTPLINDPGYYLVQSCHKLEIKVIPLPGPCSVITALCGSGLPVDRFCFEGFLPNRHNARINFLKSLLDESRTMVFYEVKHRIISSLEDMISVFGAKRYVVLVRELTKKWEFIYGASVEKLFVWAKADKMHVRGEIVLIVSGNYIKKNDVFTPKICNVMRLLALELPLKKAVNLVSYMYDMKKNVIYDKYISDKLNSFDI